MLIEYRFEILLLQAIVCSLSVMSSGIIIFFYLYLQQLKQSFTFMVIFNIALSDFLLWGIRLAESIHGMITSSTFTGDFCKILGYLQISLALTNFFWISVMSYCIYNSIIHHRGDFLRQKKKFYIFSYIVPAVLSLVPFTTKNYGPTDDIKCWITGDFSGSLDRIFMFYLPLILVLTYSFWTVYRVWGSLKIPVNDHQRSREITRIRNQFLYFPLVLAFCYFIPLVHRVLDFIDPTYGQTHVMLILHYMSAPLQGFFNAVVYGTSNKDVRKKLKFIFCCICLRRPALDDERTVSLFQGEEETVTQHENIINASVKEKQSISENETEVVNS